MYVLVDAIKRAGSLDRDAVVSALEKTNVVGAWGTHSFVPLSEGHYANWQLVLAQVENGKYVTVYPASVAERPVKLPDWYKPGQ